MARFLAMVVFVAALGASGAAIYTHVQHDGLATFVHRLGYKQNGRSAAEDELLSAGTRLAADHQTNKTYQLTNLSRFHDLTIGYTTENTYCVQVQKAGRWYHMTGPDGVPLDGPC
jgi:hypothetical protein